MFDLKMRIFIGLIVTMFIFVMGLFYAETKSQQQLHIAPFDLQTVSDGVYEGEASTVLIKANVEVSVKNHRITDIKLLEHQHNRAEQAKEVLDDIVEFNTIDVDNVSGATASSLVMKAAVADALRADK